MAVLVTADDDEDIRMLVTRSLRKAGHEVIAVADGLEGLAAVRKHHPDAVITDIDMPHMTGLQLCREIRRDPELKHIPVVVVSGSIDTEDIHALEAGVTVVIAKPFAAGVLLHQLTEVLAHPSHRAGRPLT
jgi:CheY-like chemotaxis protein